MVGPELPTTMPARTRDFQRGVVFEYFSKNSRGRVRPIRKPGAEEYRISPTPGQLSADPTVRDRPNP
jgi:hypothetical protein